MAYEHQVEVLGKVLNYHKRSLQNGLNQRSIMHKAIEAGEDVENYRSEWLKDSVIRVFELLELIAIDFNNSHKDDRCSSLDLADILTSTLATLTRSDD